MKIFKTSKIRVIISFLNNVQCTWFINGVYIFTWNKNYYSHTNVLWFVLRMFELFCVFNKQCLYKLYIYTFHQQCLPVFNRPCLHCTTILNDNNFCRRCLNNQVYQVYIILTIFFSSSYHVSKSRIAHWH